MGATLNNRMVFLDNTVLTNFAQVGRPDLIFALWGDRACTTAPVIAEYLAGVQTSLLPTEAWDVLPVIELPVDEIILPMRLTTKLGAGERSCLAAALHFQGMFASDDQQARKIALQSGLTVIGSVGILMRSVQKSLLSKTDAQVLLERMILSGYHSPISNLDEILD